MPWAGPEGGGERVRLKSLTLSGFKSFPDRTHLDFGEGISVVVGPNGSGKSNVTDAVLWAMGEQSPLAVRGQSMQDVIFGGGRGVKARSAAEVEIVLDNSDGTVDLPLSEISIVRRLDRNGEGGYRLNGARCRLTDVIEVLSDTGLGKETHSVISQGRVESIVTSKPRDRRMLIEEAAGLGKHRKRRRRAQLKLEHTQENLDRALDVEREARTRLRPLKRQAEAAELHERLERQILQARWELSCDAVRARRIELAAAEQGVAAARAARGGIETELEKVVRERGAAESALSERAERHDALSRRVYGTRSARERLGLRAEQVAAQSERLGRRIERLQDELESLTGAEGAAPDETADTGREGRIAELEAALVEVERRHGEELAGQLERLEAELITARERDAEAEQRLAGARGAREQVDAEAQQAREQLAGAEREAGQARREAERIGAELAAANQFLRSHMRIDTAGGGEPARSLSGELTVRDGYELALAAALGGRLDAAVVDDVPGAEALLDRCGPDGGSALLAGGAASDDAGAGGVGGAPVSGAERLLDLLDGPPEVMALARRLLRDAWVVDRLESLPRDFGGVAATRSGRVWFAGWGEVRQLSAGGSELLLARRNERDRLVAESERAAQVEVDAQQARERRQEAVQASEQARLEADDGLRAAERARSEAAEGLRQAGWLIEQRRAAPAEGPLAVRKAQIEGELGAERRQAAEQLRLAQERQRRIETLRVRLAADREHLPRAERLAAVLTLAGESCGALIETLESELEADRRAGEEMAGTLRACAAREAEIQGRLRACGEEVTAAEVAAQRLRDQAAEAELEYTGLAERLGFQAEGGESGSTVEPQAAETESESAEAETVESESAEPESIGTEAGQPNEPLDEQQVEVLQTRIARLQGRREQLGPVNPLAQQEYAEAVEHVEELETQRADLETALRELRKVIRDTDREIEQAFSQTFEAAARNFEELVGDVFPGGSGRLRLVHDEQSPRAVIGGQAVEADGEGDADAASEAAADAEVEAELSGIDEEPLPGVEIEITPEGKSSKRLTLLSGGEKSMTALAFLFAVFLARPCPFYILDEVEAALDDLNLDRFLSLLRRYSSRAQFIVITHQKRTMEAADYLFGVSMGGDGVSKVLSRRLPAEADTTQEELPAGEVHLAEVS
jgi:chromosome segregation protein